MFRGKRVPSIPELGVLRNRENVYEENYVVRIPLVYKGYTRVVRMVLCENCYELEEENRKLKNEKRKQFSR